jgi:hypothetical protein
MYIQPDLFAINVHAFRVSWRPDRIAVLLPPYFVFYPLTLIQNPSYYKKITHTKHTPYTQTHKSVTFSLMSFSRPRNTFFLLSYHQREIIITKLLVTIDETKKSILNVVRMNGAVLCRESVWMLLRWERPGRHSFVRKCQRHAQPGIFTLIAFVKVQTDAKSL